MCRNRLETDHFGAVSMRFRDLIIGGFPSPALLRDELVQISVELKDHTGRERHAGMIGMNGRQDLSIAGNLLLGAVLRRGLLLYKFPDSIRWGLDALDPVG